MATQFDTRVYFESGSDRFGPETFGVISFEGEERLSGLYRFVIDLASEDPDVDMDAIISHTAVLRMTRDENERRIHGVLTEFEQLKELKGSRFLYRAVLVPRMWLLSLNRQNQIYQNMTIPQIVEHEITARKHIGAGGAVGAGLVGDDVEFRLTREYPVKEYVVQYNESDFNFISRLMEHEGLYYYFEQLEEREKLIVSDNNIHFMAPADADEPVPYRPPDGMATFVEESVQSIGLKQSRIPKKFMIKEYNYRMAHLPLQAEAENPDPAYGLVSTYGDHFGTPEEGQVLAGIRAQEARCTRKRYTGEADVITFTPGLQFNLAEHFREDFNRGYVLTSVSHQGGQPDFGADGVAPDTTAVQKTEYRNTYSAIPAEVPFRPQRRTPKPRLYGIMNAHVDAAMLEDRAEVDDKGRYKLVMPFDASGAGAGKATRWVRMATPYGGSRHGMHFPLHKGTEVIWTCIDGDPDRPIIIGTVPNPLQPSVVTSRNATRNVLQTASGVKVEIEDGPPVASNGTISRPENLSPQQQMQASPGSGPSAGNRGQGEGGITAMGIGIQTRSTVSPQQQRQAADPLTGDVADQVDNTNKWYKISVPDYDGSKDTYVRLGKADPDEAVETEVKGMQHDLANQQNDGRETSSEDLHGIFEYTDGNRTEIVRGNKDEFIEGRRRITIKGGDAGIWDAGLAHRQYMRPSIIPGTTRLTTVQNVQSDTYEYGDKESVFGGFSFDGMIGLASSMFIGGKLDVNLAAQVRYDRAFDVSFGKQNSLEMVDGEKVSITETEQMKADKSIILRVPYKDKHKAARHLGSKMALAATIGALAATAGVNALNIKDYLNGENLDDLRDWQSIPDKVPFGVMSGASLAAYAAMLVYGIKRYKEGKNRIDENKPVDYIDKHFPQDSIIYLDDDDIVITSGPNTIKLHEDKTGKGSLIHILVDQKQPKSEVLVEAKTVTVNSAEKLELKSDQTVDIKSAKAINITSDTADIKIQGLGVRMNPQSGVVHLA